jgi:hypothetical protein
MVLSGRYTFIVIIYHQIFAKQYNKESQSEFHMNVVNRF